MRSLDQLMDQYDRGVLTRRQLMSGLLAVAMPAAAANAGTQATAAADPIRARTINHVHIVVNNYEESRTFYEKLLGAKFQHEFGKDIHSVVLPGGGGWLSLDNGTSQVDPEKKNRLGHLAVGIEKFDVKEVMTAVQKNLPGVKVEQLGNRSCFVYDPNGIRVQLIAKEDQGAS
jgi:catechol 2,3-dioxygenase-like lactoylglutathione lyase family enzyme